MIGAGSWGTALAMVLARNGHRVVLWDIDTDVLDDINRSGENRQYLPGHPLPDAVHADPELDAALDRSELVVIAVPSPAVRTVARRSVAHLSGEAMICCVAKGVEVSTLMTMHEVLEDELPAELHDRLTFLSGPSFAKEVAQAMPTAVSLAARRADVATTVQSAFANHSFRPYTTSDVMGVEIGGCVKNVIAIASGAAQGLGFRANSRSALITRGLAEITRLAVARGADPRTLTGLAGVGDLMLTCSSDLSRNFRVGFGLGRGRELDEVQAELGQVAEGVVNAQSTWEMSHRYGVDMPISETVYRILYDGLHVTDALDALMSRQTRPELDAE